MPIPARVAQWNKVGLNRVVRHIRAPHRHVLRLLGVADFLSLTIVG